MTKPIRGSYEALSQKLKDRHDRAIGQLSKLTNDLFDTLSTDQLKKLMDKLLYAEIFSLRITRSSYVDKIKSLNSYLKENRNTSLKEMRS